MHSPRNVSLIVCILAVAWLVLSPYATGYSGIWAQVQKTTSTIAKVKKVTLIADERPIQIASDDVLHPGGIKYNAMVFNGTIPGPVIAVDQGDTLQITFKNSGKLIHSIIFQGVAGPSQSISGALKPGENRTWTLKAVNPGIFLYYGGADALNGVWEQIADGMYGGIVVHPLNEKPAKEFYLVFSEIYNTADKGIFKGTNGTTGSFDFNKFIIDRPDLILTNGMAHKYLPAIGKEIRLDLNKAAEIFKVKPGELTRWYILNAGPRESLNLNFIAGIISSVMGGSTANKSSSTQLNGYQTVTIAPGSASVIETIFPEQGSYIGIDHDMGRMLKGGAFAIMATPASTNNDQPVGTWVPPKGSNVVSGNKTISPVQPPFSPFGG